MEMEVNTSISITVLTLSPYLDFPNKDTKNTEAQEVTRSYGQFCSICYHFMIFLISLCDSALDKKGIALYVVLELRTPECSVFRSDSPEPEGDAV